MRGAARVHSFMHACSRARHSIETRSRDDATTRSIDPIVRSVASIRSHRSLSHRSRRARSRRPDRSPIRPLGPSRRARESSIEGWWIVGSLRSRSHAVDVDVFARAASTGRVDFHSCIRSFARRGRGRGRRRRRRRGDARARRDRSTRATSRRRKRDDEGVARRHAGVGDLTSRDSWTRDEEGGATARGCG